jgi:hypothetical protein
MERDIYKVTIQIKSKDGYHVKVKLEDCSREALLKEDDRITAVLRLLENSIPADGDQSR